MVVTTGIHMAESVHFNFPGGGSKPVIFIIVVIVTITIWQC